MLNDSKQLHDTAIDTLLHAHQPNQNAPTFPTFLLRAPLCILSSRPFHPTSLPRPLAPPASPLAAEQLVTPRPRAFRVRRRTPTASSRPRPTRTCPSRPPATSREPPPPPPAAAGAQYPLRPCGPEPSREAPALPPARSHLPPSPSLPPSLARSSRIVMKAAMRSGARTGPLAAPRPVAVGLWSDGDRFRSGDRFRGIDSGLYPWLHPWVVV